MTRVTDAQRHRAEQLHRDAIVINAHNDIMYDVVEQRSRGDHGVIARKHLPKMKQAGITVSVETVGGDSTLRYTFPRKGLAHLHSHLYPLKRALHTLDALLEEQTQGDEPFVVVRTEGDVRRAKAEGQVGFLLALEGGMPLEDDIALLRTFYRLGVRLVGLTWNFRNQLADGATERSGGGLTHLGLEYLKEMGRLGMIIDVSHLSEAGFWDVVKHYDGVFIASHSNARIKGTGERNLSDDMIKAIYRRGGFIGVNAVNPIITGQLDATLDDLVDHIDYIKGVVGVDNVGIGLDILEDWPKEEFDSIWGEWKVLRYPDGLSTITDLRSLTAVLVARGYSDDDIRKILGGNFQRLIQNVLGA